MLQKVILENFQAHEMSVIEFTEGINVICGASDQGKSSVIRAIRWALPIHQRAPDQLLRIPALSVA